MSNTTQEEIIATLDRIIAMQDKMIEKISNMDGKMKMITEEINNISSEKLYDDAVKSMKTYDGPR
jgi:uncharacterized coiled-coil protein SlyX